MLVSIAVAGVSLVIVAATVDYLAKMQRLSREAARKLLHIAVAVAFAVLPFFIGLTAIIWLALIDCALVFITGKLKMFRIVRLVGRQTWGEYFFLVALVLGALITDSPWVFAAGVLTLGFADSAAALVGKSWGRHGYKVFGQKKSLEGSAAFAAVALLILIVMVNFGSLVIPAGLIILPALALIAALCEAMGIYGSDNFLIPLVLIMLLENTRLIEDIVTLGGLKV